MKIAIGSDHRGFEHKKYIINSCNNVAWIDVGSYTPDRSDYPIFAHNVAQMIITKEIDCGVLICGTGAGMAIVVNRYPYLYAAVAWSCEVAQRCKEDDNSNVLVLPADYISLQESVRAVQLWLTAEFKGGIYQKRIAMIDTQ